MFCSNCGAKNNSDQNFCRFCGLNLSDAARSLNNQIVFGKNSDALKRWSAVKQTTNIASTAAVSAVAVGAMAHFIFAVNSTDVLKISIAALIIIKMVQQAISYFRREKTIEASGTAEDQLSAGSATNKLPPDKPFGSPESVTEDATELLKANRETRKF
jgi:hypothetical protein